MGGIRLSGRGRSRWTRSARGRLLQFYESVANGLVRLSAAPEEAALLAAVVELAGAGAAAVGKEFEVRGVGRRCDGFSQAVEVAGENDAEVQRGEGAEEVEAL